MPASPYRRLDSGAIGSLAAGYPLNIFEPHDPRLTDLAEYLVTHCVVNEKGEASEKARASAKRAIQTGEEGDSGVSAKRSRAVSKALKREPHAAASKTALSRQARAAAKRRAPSDRAAAARKAARTKGRDERSAAARKAARTRAKHGT
jgi:hypothetical protein